MISQQSEPVALVAEHPSMITGYENHPAAGLFHMMGETELQQLAEDIRQNGLLEPIAIFEGKVIDGRNRLAACLRAEVEPRFQDIGNIESPILYVASKNLRRRHLTPSQCAVVAAEMIPLLADEAKRRQVSRLRHGDETPLAQVCADGQQGKAAKLAAEACGVSGRTAEMALAVKRNDPEVFERVRTGETSVNAAYRELPHVARNSGNNEWYTPQPIIDSAREVLGGLDLDPASCATANTVVKADTFFDKAMDGLKQPWKGRVWLNPPYASNLVGQFTQKLLDHREDGTVTGAIVLVNNATDTQWFQAMAKVAQAICFPASRVRFWHPFKTETTTPLQGQAFLYFGNAEQEFGRVFAKYGYTCTIFDGIGDDAMNLGRRSKVIGCGSSDEYRIPGGTNSIMHHISSLPAAETGCRT
jgi:ParB family chromosome partitioning protein